MFSEGIAHTRNFTADSVVGTSGQRMRLFSMHFISGASAASINLRNGTSASATNIVRETGTANTGKTIDYGPFGLYFPSGLFLDLDTNTVSVLLTFIQEN